MEALNRKILYKHVCLHWCDVLNERMQELFASHRSAKFSFSGEAFYVWHKKGTKFHPVSEEWRDKPFHKLRMQDVDNFCSSSTNFCGNLYWCRIWPRMANKKSIIWFELVLSSYAPLNKQIN